MKYRLLGKTELKISEIAFGTEHLEKVKKGEIKKVIRAAVAAGINYFDVIMDNPEYLEGFGEAFEGIRDKVIITSHIPTLESLEKCKTRFNDFLNKVGCGYVDFLILSSCDREEVYNAVTDLSGRKTDEINIRTLGQDFNLKNHGGHLKYAKELQKKGLVKHLGFSTHVMPLASRAIKDGYFDLIMFPINPIFDALPGKAGAENLGELWDLADRHENINISSERKELQKLCLTTKTALIAMKPFAAGWLFKPDLKADITVVKLLSYVLSQSGVSAALPGITTLEHLKNCLKFYEAADNEKDFSGIIAKLKWNPKGSCMYCNHCQPCTVNIDIAQVNKLYDAATEFGMQKSIKEQYDALIIKPDSCVKCGECIKRCPFGIDARGRMHKAAELFL